MRILGNNDDWDDKTVQRRAGAEPPGAAGAWIGLRDDAVRLLKDARSGSPGSAINCLFSRRHFRPVTRIGIDDLDATLAKVTDDAPVILWRTSPTLRVRVPSASVAVFFRDYPMAVKSELFGGRRWCRRVTANRLALWPCADQLRRRRLRSLGCSIMPIRLGVPPEIVLSRGRIRAAMA